MNRNKETQPPPSPKSAQPPNHEPKHEPKHEPNHEPNHEANPSHFLTDSAHKNPPKNTGACKNSLESAGVCKKPPESSGAYKKRVDRALSNEFLRGAMDRFAVAYRGSRQSAFEELDRPVDELIAEVAAMKREALKNGKALMDMFQKKAHALGIHVHIAETA
ncbi:MAG: hypothetical protein HQK66_14665, partial [Desulfamplus sp.]|nr:hypothetical protein [Desulfamplus sp.]